MTTRSLKVARTTAEALAPYGSLITVRGLKPTVEGDNFAYWDALAVDEATRGMSLGIVRVEPFTYRGTTFERHTASAELLVPMDGEVIFVLGQATAGNIPDLDRFAAFRVAPGEAVMLHPGTWHYAPVATRDATNVLVAYGAGTGENDKQVVQIATESGVEFLLAE